MMDIGIRSATPAGLRVSAVDAARGTSPASGFSAHNGGRSDGAWHTFGPSRGSTGMGAGRSSQSGPIHGGAGFGGSHFGGSSFGNSLSLDRVRVTPRSDHLSNARFGSSTHLFGGSRFNSFGGHRGFGGRGFGSGWGWRGNGYGGFGWRGYGWNRGLLAGILQLRLGRWLFWSGLRLGLGLWRGMAVLGQLLGTGLGLRMDPWWYNPYWYTPWPSYNYYQDYPDIGYNNPPAYAPDALSDYDPVQLPDHANPGP